MNPIVSSSLIHFTKRFDSLKSILRNGIRYSYCSEEYPSALAYNIKNIDTKGFQYNNIYSNKSEFKRVLIPMVSFCDIPLTRSHIHTKKYGFYGIGIDRDFARSIYKNLMPVQYMSSDRFQTAISELSIILAKHKDLDKQIIDSIKLIIGTTKTYNVKREKQNILCYEEREWRLIYSDDKETPWGWGISDKKTKDEYNSKLHTNKDLSYFSFIRNEDKLTECIVNENINKLITHIIVKKEEQIPIIANFILNERNSFFGYRLSKDSRLLLISKLISYERLNKDF